MDRVVNGLIYLGKIFQVYLSDTMPIFQVLHLGV